MDNTVVMMENHEGIGIITINRPDKLNALNGEVIEQLDEIIQTLKTDPKIQAVIFRGAGEKSFVAGADIS